MIQHAWRWMKPGSMVAALLALAAAGCTVDNTKETALWRGPLDEKMQAAASLAPDQVLTLDQAMAMVNAHDERLALSGENYLQALIDRDRAIARLLPSISLAPSSQNTAIVGFQSAVTLATSVTATVTGSMSGITIGMAISGTNIPSNTVVSAIAGNYLTLSHAATGSGSITATFSPAVGAYDTEIPIISAGSNISAQAGQLAAFKIGSEYFLAYVRSSTQLSFCQRGTFFGSTDANLPAAGASAGATITLMKMAWAYLTSAGALVISYTNPVYGPTQPSSGTSGDMWYDYTDGNWYTYNGSTWILANCAPLGLVIADASHCIASRSFDFYLTAQRLNTVVLDYLDTATTESTTDSAKVSVYGHVFGADRFKWAVPTNLDTGSSLTASTNYYCYVSKTGANYLSLIAPIDRTGDLLGMYHPAKPWRCVGGFTADSGGLVQAPFSYKEGGQKSASVGLGSSGAFQVTSATLANVTNLTKTIGTSGNPVLICLTSDPYQNPSFFGLASGSILIVAILRDGVIIGEWEMVSTTGHALTMPCAITMLDPATAGTHTYTVQASSFSGTDSIYSAQLQVAEL